MKVLLDECSNFGDLLWFQTEVGGELDGRFDPELRLAVDMLYRNVVLEPEEAGAVNVEGDRRERHDAELAGHAVLVTEREAALPELRIPADSIQELPERLHAAWGTPAYGSGINVVCQATKRQRSCCRAHTSVKRARKAIGPRGLFTAICATPVITTVPS